MGIVKWANLGLRFLLELGILAAAGYWGFNTGTQTSAKIVLGIGAPLLVALGWGIFLAPASPRRLAEPGRLLAELAIFGVAIAALYSTGAHYLAGAFALTYALNKILLTIWRQ